MRHMMSGRGKRALLALAAVGWLLISQACDPTATTNPLQNFYGDPPVVYTFLNSLTGQETAVRIAFPAYTNNVKVSNPTGFTFLRSGALLPGLLQQPMSVHKLGGGAIPPDPDEFGFDPWDIPDPPDPFLPDPPFDDFPPPPDPFDDPFDGLPDPPIDLPPLPSDDLPLTDYSPGTVTVTGLGSSASGGANQPESTGGKRPRSVMVRANIQVGPLAAGIVNSPDKSTLYVAVGGAANIAVIDRRSLSITRRIALPSGAQPYSLAITPDGKRLYTGEFVGNSNGSLYSIDLPNGPVKQLAGAGSYVTHALVTRDGTQVWFCNYFGGNVLIYDVLTNALITSLPIQFAWDVAFNASGTRAYITNGPAGAVGAVAVIDAASLQTIASIPVGMTPKNIRITPSGRHLFVTNYDSNFMTQIDTSTNQVIRNIPVGGTGANGIGFANN